MATNSTKMVDFRPSKPSPDFPLFPHRSGQWAKKVKGKAFYFGSWRTDPTGQEALAVYEAEAPYLNRGEQPPPTATGDTITVHGLCNLFLEAKEKDVDGGVIVRASFTAYLPTCKRLVKHYGKARQVKTISKTDWANYRLKILKAMAPNSASVEIAKVKCVGHWGAEFDHIEPVNFGKAFARAPKKLILKHKAEGGSKVFTREEVKAILQGSDRQLKAIVLFALNTGYGNSDIAALPENAIDFDSGFVTFARVKTGVARRCPLWPQTIEAIREWLPRRPKPTEKRARGLAFLTTTGRPWVRDGCRADVLGIKFRRLLKRLEIGGRRSLGFYGLRHTMATVGANSRDTDAVRAILGHTDPHTSAEYIESIDDDRLQAVVNVVRDWLFGGGGVE